MAPSNLHTTHAPDVFNWVWDAGTSEWVKETQAGGSGGGAVTIADGADVAQGTTSDAAWVSGSGTVISLLKKLASAGAGSAVSIADGSDVAEGATTDSAVVTDVAGTVSGKLRGLVKIFASVWDSVNGRLKVDGSAVTQPVSAASLPLPTGAATSGLQTTGNTSLSSLDTKTPALGQTTMAASSPVVLASDQSSVPVTATPATQTAATATWTSATALNTAVTITVTGMSMGMLSVRKTGAIATGQVTVELSNDGSNFTQISTGFLRSVSGVLANPFDLSGLLPLVWEIDGTGWTTMRLRLSTVIGGAGSIDIRLNATSAPVSTPVGTLTVSGSVTQGNTATTNAQGWWTRIGDATNGPVAVKAASTAVVATDPALAVSLSPNSSLPTGTNVIGHVINDSGSTTAVTGTVATNVSQVGATAVDTNSGVKSAGTLRVVLATDQPALTNKLLVTPDSVALPANQSVNVSQFGGTNASTGTGASGAGIPRVTVANDSNVLVTPPTLTKATQGATGFTTQDLKDAGRVSIAITATVASTATAETLISVNRSSGLAAVAAGSSLTITSGKRFRIQALAISARNSTGTVASNVTVNLRAAVAGATTAASPLQLHFMVALPASAVSTLFPPILIPDGFEIDSNAGTNTFGFTITHPQWVTGTQVATFDISLIGYEY